MPARARLCSCGLAFLGATCGALPLASQTQFEVEPYVGLYWPTSSLASEGSVTLQKQLSVIRGARITLSTGRLSVEGTVGYAPSGIWSSVSGLTYPAQEWAGGIKARLRVTPPTAWAALQVGGGVGVVGHRGYAYPPWYTGPFTYPGGIANGSAVIKLVRWVGVRFDAEDFVYPAHIGYCTRFGAAQGGVCDIFFGTPVSAYSSGTRLQNDLVLSVGVALACCGSGSRSQ